MARSTSLFLILLPVSLLGLRTDQVAAHLVILQVVVHALLASLQLELVCKAPQPCHTQFATVVAVNSNVLKAGERVSNFAHQDVFFSYPGIHN